MNWESGEPVNPVFKAFGGCLLTENVGKPRPKGEKGFIGCQLPTCMEIDGFYRWNVEYRVWIFTDGMLNTVYGYMDFYRWNVDLL